MKVIRVVKIWWGSYLCNIINKNYLCVLDFNDYVISKLNRVSKLWLFMLINKEILV